MTPEKGSSMPAIPKPDEAAKTLFEAVVPDHPAVKVRPMFGNLAAFVNGNMFMGLFGPEIFLRLPEEDREAVAKEGGWAFAPMPGRPMREYVVLPSAWRDHPATVRQWVARSLGHAEELPPKEAKPRAAKKRG